MHPALEFVFGRVDHAYPAYFGPGDAAGEHGLTLRYFRDVGFLGPDRVPHPTPGCTFCHDGVPYRLCGRLVCDSCGSGVPEEHLYLWPLDMRALLDWFAAQQHLDGAVVRIDDGLWQLGSLVLPPHPRTCFFLRGGTSSDIGLRRINACQAPVVLHGALQQPRLPDFAGKTLSLLELLRYEGTLSVLPLPAFLRRGGRVRFTESGELLAGDEPLGWVPLGTREYWLVDCLYRRRGHVVPFDEIRRHVRAHCPGSRDATDAATFCQKLRSRVKKAHGVIGVERLIASGKRSGGYLMPATAFLEAA